MTLSESLYSWLKKRIYRSRLTAQLMHRWRARIVEHRYAKFVAENGNNPWTYEYNKLRLSQRIKATRFQQNDGSRVPRTLWIGTDYEQDSSGFIQALRKVTDLSLFTQENGQYGYLLDGRELSFGMVEGNNRRLFNLLQSAEDDGHPYEIVIGQMWAGYTDEEFLGVMRKQFDLVVVNVAMDDRHTFDLWKVGRRIGTKRLASHIDLALTAAPECVAWYQNIGTPALFFPEASDPSVFAGASNEIQDVDVCFVGAKYGIRERIIEALEGAGIRTVTYGSGWERGRIPMEQVPNLFHRSKIVLGVGTIGSSETLVSLKLRDFDGPMSGTCYVTQHNSDFEQLFEIDKEIVCYTSIQDCVKRVRQLLDNDKLRIEIGNNGQKRAMTDHTWDSRFRLLFRLLHDARSVSNKCLKSAQ